MTKYFLISYLVVMLCVFAGNAGAVDDMRADLKCKDWVKDTPDTWLEDVGYVNISSDGKNLMIDMGLNPLEYDYYSDLNIDPNIMLMLWNQTNSCGF